MAKYEGSSCLYWTYFISNFGILLVAIGSISIGVYLYFVTQLISYFILGFIVFGVLVLLLSILGFRVRNSPIALGCYFWTMMVLLVIQLVAMAASYFFSDDIIEWMSKQNAESGSSAKEFQDMVRSNVKVTGIVALSFAAAQVSPS